jgi:MFS family permease
MSLPDASIAAAAAEPADKPVRIARLLTFLLPAVTGLFSMFQGIQQILFPAQLEAIDPAHKVGNLAVITTIVAVASMLAIPIGGALSDRTRSRFGRRTPWILVWSVASGVLMVLMGLADNLVVLGVVITVLWFTSNAYQGALVAVLPDRVPEGRRGFAAALIGLATPFGVLIGVNVASAAGQVLGYVILAVLLVVTALAFVFGAKEDSSLDLVRPVREKVGLGSALGAFFAAFRHRDFTLAFVSRFALFLSYFTVSGFLFFTVSDYIGVDQLPGGDPAAAVATLLTVTVGFWIVIATFLGWLADKLDRRKLFVGISAVGLAATMFIPIISPTWTGMMVYSAFLGIFIGTYFAVDLAVMSLVLPNKEQEGRDLGILAVATGLPSIMSGAIAGAIITFLGGYASLYIFGAIVAIVSGVTIFFIRKVR